MTEELISFKEKPNTKEELNELLNPTIKKWFFSKFKEFSLPQLYGVYEVHSRNNVLISAPTGATKTLTSFLSILNELVDLSEKGFLENKIYCIYISPLKALNNDIFKNLVEPLEEIEKINGKNLGIKVAVRTGDTTQAERAIMLKKVPHILITTPESIALLLSSIKFRENLKNVDWIIVDEIHALAENKRGVHLSLSLERLQRLNSGMCRIGLSATIEPLVEIAKFLAGNERKCKIINVQFIKQLDLKVLSPLPDLIDTSFIDLNKETYNLLDKLIQEHKTTLIFTNTRSGTERVVHHLKTKFPNKYTKIDDNDSGKVESLIGAHHGSLSKEHRFQIEDALRKGKLRVVVCSTSLELGIDIGYIDLVICLGSPKSIARLKQRIGRSAHRLHATTKGRIIVLDRDDLVECSVMSKNAIEHKIDRVHIPNNCLDVLAQQIFGIALEEVIDLNELYKLIKKSYCYRNLDKNDFDNVIKYLSGEFSTLEDRNVYAKIWVNENKIGKRGKMARVIYMTNSGTIPDESNVKVKINDYSVGTVEEEFLEKLKKGDIFVLGGNTYEFKFSRGTVAQVVSAEGKRPTVPSWFSEMLPLSFDLANEVGRFRHLMEQKLKTQTREEIIKFINEFLYLDKNAAEAIYNYFKEQYNFLEIPHYKKILIENYKDEKGKMYVIFHTLYGRRVNDALSRSLAYIIGLTQHRDVEISFNDNGFYLSYEKNVNVIKAFNSLKTKELKRVLEFAIDKSEVLKRRFRHCAMRSLMILREYKGRRKRVGRQQVSSMILMSAVKRISNDFVILKEARREIMEDLMDIENTLKILDEKEKGNLEIKEVNSVIPSPFALNLIVQGYSDILKMEDRIEFLKRMHKMILAKISIKK